MSHESPVLRTWWINPSLQPSLEHCLFNYLQTLDFASIPPLLSPPREGFDLPNLASSSDDHTNCDRCYFSETIDATRDLWNR